MTRLGPWVFATGIILLCAGVVSTRSEAWKKSRDVDVQTIALDLRGVDTLDVQNLDRGKVVIAMQPTQVRIQRWPWIEHDEKTAPMVMRRDGNRMHLDFGKTENVFGGASVDLAPGLKLLSGRGLQVEAIANAGALSIESRNLHWEGDADRLDIRARARSEEAQPLCSDLPEVQFARGRVGQLRISIERGRVQLGDLTQVARIELHAGPEVSLSLNRIDDLPRIQMLPFDGEATPPPAGVTGPCPNFPRGWIR